MWPPFVVIAAPVGDDSPGLEEVLEPADTQAFLAQLAVEPLHVCVPCGLARLDGNEIDLAIERPGKEMATRRLGAVVTTYGLRPTAVGEDLVEHPRNAQAGEACVHLHGKALACKRVDHVEHADRAARSHRVMHEIQRPLLVGRRIDPQRCAQAHAVLPLLAA